MREEAELEAGRRRADAAADAEAELAMAKQQGREMVEEARAYRERVLGELARRRDLARQQIEQLVHGRDRLLQAFERARLVAVDVVAELSPLGAPEEYVDLTPTTGPVPIMVPAASIGDAPASMAATPDEVDDAGGDDGRRPTRSTRSTMPDEGDEPDDDDDDDVTATDVDALFARLRAVPGRIRTGRRGRRADDAEETPFAARDAALDAADRRRRPQAEAGAGRRAERGPRCAAAQRAGRSTSTPSCPPRASRRRATPTPSRPS